MSAEWSDGGRKETGILDVDEYRDVNGSYEVSWGGGQMNRGISYH